MTRSVAGLLVAAAVALAGCGGRDPANDLVARLAKDPGLVPPPVADGESVVLLDLAVDGTTVVIPNPPLLQPGARLRLERALLARRTSPPTLWVVVTSPDGGTVRYWCATTDQAAIRGTLPDRNDRAHKSVWHRARGNLTSFRIPFVPDGRLAVYRSSGGRLARFRLGAEPEAPLTREPS